MKGKVVLVLWLFFIFYLSTTTSIKVLDPNSWFNPTIYSDNVSLLDILRHNSQFYWSYTEGHQDMLHFGEEFYARKIGHCILYGVLAVILFYNIKKHKIILSWFFSTFFAIADELNQYLMVGRSGRALDVLLDSTAALCTLLVFSLFLGVKKLFSYRRIQKESRSL